MKTCIPQNAEHLEAQALADLDRDYWQARREEQKRKVAQALNSLTFLALLGLVLPLIGLLLLQRFLP